MKNIFLHNLKYNDGSIKERKRLGRGKGSGHGLKCGKGSNGNKQRSGYKKKFGFEGGQTPLKRRLPMIRRINKYRTDKPKTVTFEMLRSIISSGVKKIDPNVLSEYRIIKLSEKYKIVNGCKSELDLKDVTIEANGFSKNAKDFIEKNGGKIVNIEDRDK